MINPNLETDTLVTQEYIPEAINFDNPDRYQVRDASGRFARRNKGDIKTVIQTLKDAKHGELASKANKVVDEVEEEKKIIYKNLRSMGDIRAHFYDDDDLRLFERLMRMVKLTPKWVRHNPRLLHTVFPPFHLPIQEHQETSGDSYGILRLNASQFFARPSFANVESCHAIYDGAFGTNAAGNLGYLALPWWSCVAVYDNLKSENRISTNYYHRFSVPVSEFNLPNLLCTFNICLGWVDGGIPGVYVSRAYGDTSVFKKVFPRFSRYMRSNYGLQIYLSNKWHRHLYGNDYVIRPGRQKILRTPMYKPMLMNDNGSYPYRYGDIEYPFTHSASGGYNRGENGVQESLVCAHVPEEEYYSILDGTMHTIPKNPIAKAFMIKDPAPSNVAGTLAGWGPVWSQRPCDRANNRI